jgi:hypothetical protein
MFAEMLADLPGVHPGCLTASYCYQERLFDREICDLNRTGVLRWHQRFRERLDLIRERYPPLVEVDFDALADMAAAIVDGGITLSKTLKDPALLPQQVLLYRQFIRAVFLTA